MGNEGRNGGGNGGGSCCGMMEVGNEGGSSVDEAKGIMMEVAIVG